MKLKYIDCIHLQYNLVNSISFISDRIYYTSALDNLVCELDLNTRKEKVVVGALCGYGKYKFREPVHAKAIKVKDDIFLFVSDWHNHRVVKYKNGVYMTEIGFYSPSSCFFVNLFSFVVRMNRAGSYIESHFGNSFNTYKIKTKFITNLIYFISSSLRLLRKRFFYINKPNGICLYLGNILLTQKNGNVLSHFDFNLNHLDNFFTPENGRLGNVNSCHNGAVFCIESEGVIYIMKNDGVFYKIPLLPINIEFKPFSALFYGKKSIVVISMSNVHVFDTSSGMEKARYTVDGELHGLDINDSLIYVSDRKNGKIYILGLIDD